MTLTNLQYIRLTLNLPRHVVLREPLGVGDSETVKFKTQLWPLIEGSETIRVDSEPATIEEDYAVHYETGLVTFETAPDTGEFIDADYQWSVFSDIQITDLLERYNDQVNPVKRDLVMALLANSDLFIKYTTGMESVDRTRALEALRGLYDELKGAPAGAIAQSVVWTAADVDAYERDVPWEPFISSTPRD